MNCDPSKDLIESYIDGELDASLAAQVREHIAVCQSCAETHRRHQALSTGLREHAPRYEAPPHLRDRIQRALRRSTLPWPAMALAASILLAVSLGWNIALLRSRHADLAHDILSSHLRSLAAAQLVDVPSSDRHTVKPWFAGKLDFSPEVKDLAGQGFPLEGARVDYVGNRRVAALVYRARQHVITLFTWPSGSQPVTADLTENGYHLIHWSRAGAEYSAVSDVNLADLREFARLYQQ